MLVIIECSNPGLTAHKIRREIVEYLSSKHIDRRRLKVLNITHRKIMIVIEAGIEPQVIDDITRLISKYGVKVEVLRDLSIST